MTVAEYFTDVRPNRRIHNALVRGGIHTMAEASAISEGELTRVRSFGVFLETEDVGRIIEC